MDLAKSLDTVPIIALHHLNRLVDREDRPPTLADLRDSGKIEDDASSVIVLKRKTSAPLLTEVHVLKNRNGETGEVKLQSADWRAEPEVAFNLLSDSRDLERLADGFRRMAALHALDAMKRVTDDPFPASYSDKVRQVGVINQKNRVLTDIMAKLLDGPAALRKYLLKKLVMEEFTLEQVLADEEAMEAFVRRTAVGVWHASCTCRMGADDDPMAVTDPAGRVRGVEGLRVCDASVFPVVPCANTNVPTLMTAEKIADAILAGH
jgi:5-(hydroxymethyl)furfural/furfural oxidase